MPLNDIQIRNAKPKEKAYKLADEKGLTLLINPNGSKWWRFRYRVGGREKMISLGVYPEISLKKARDRRDEQRKLVAEKIDPSQVRQSDKASLSNTFEGTAREWFNKHAKNWKDSHSSKILARLEKDVFPWIGTYPIINIKASDLLACLRRVELRGKLDSAHRILQNCSAIFRYAVAIGRVERDLCVDLKGAIPPAKVRHHPTITDPQKIAGLLRAIDGYEGSIVVRCALQLAPHVFLRPGELRQAEWTEINFNECEWRIPAQRMKMDEQHIVPLSDQSIRIFEELKPITGSGKYVFPSGRSYSRPMSNNAITAALRRMGFEQGTMTAHGFRSMASTLLNEQGFNRDWIERQLAHGERDKIRAAYNYAQYLPERRKMMQAWSDYLNEIRNCGDENM